MADPGVRTASRLVGRVLPWYSLNAAAESPAKAYGCPVRAADLQHNKSGVWAIHRHPDKWDGLNEAWSVT